MSAVDRHGELVAELRTLLRERHWLYQQQTWSKRHRARYWNRRLRCWSILRMLGKAKA